MEASRQVQKLQYTVSGLLKDRLLHLKDLVVPFYEHSLAPHGFSKSDLPPWPADLGDDTDKQRLVTEYISRLLQLACQASTASRNESSKGSLTAATTIYLPLPNSVYYNLELDPRRSNIRILEVQPGTADIQCILKVEDIQNSQGYEAVSYVWGSPSLTAAIVVNRTKVRIRDTLHSLLLAFRLPDRPRRLWVDAVCIDQENDSEKSWQVAMMADIYRSAEKVLIFLGEEGDSDPLFKFCKREPISTGIGKDETIDAAAARCKIPVPDLLQAYVDFSSRPWFTRIWTYQERALAKSPPLWHCGQNSIANDLLRKDSDMLFDACSLHHGPTTGYTLKAEKTEKNHDKFVDQLSEVHRMLSFPSVTHVWRSLPAYEYRTLHRVSTNPQDVVYGMREFFEPVFQSVFQPDYTMKTETLFMRLSAWLLIIDQWGDVFEAFPSRYSSHLPSWVRNFSHLPPPVSSPRKPPLPMSCGILGQVLVAEGCLVDEVADVFHVDEEDILILLGRLWHLDQLFIRTQPTAHWSHSRNALSTSMSIWAMGHKQLTLNRLLPQADLTLTVLDSIMESHVAHLQKCLERYELPSADMLEQLSEDELMEYVNKPATEKIALQKRLLALLALYEYIIASMDTNEDLLGASVYDHANLMDQLQSFKDAKAHNITTPSMPKLGCTNAGLEKIVYKDTTQFLRDKNDPLLVEVLMMVAEAVREETVKAQNAWLLSASPYSSSEPQERSVVKVVADANPNMSEFDSSITSAMQATLTTDKQKSETTKSASTIERDRNVVVDNKQKESVGTELLEPRNFSIEKLADILAGRFSHRTFFVTKSGLAGVGTERVRDIQPGDKLLCLNNMHHPLLVRDSLQKPAHYEIVGTTIVSEIMGWGARADAGFTPRKFNII